MVKKYLTSETAVERRLRGVERMYRSIPGMCPTRHEQDATADAVGAGREAIRILADWENDETPQDGPSREWKARVAALLARCEGEK